MLVTAARRGPRNHRSDLQRRVARIAAWLLTLCLMAGATSPVAAASPTGIPAPSLQAGAAVLMDAGTGQVLYARAPTLRVAPGGLAALMTFALTLRAIAQGQLTPQTRVTISSEVWHIALNPNDSRMFLEVGQRVPVRDLLLGLMVDGGDDAALALAEAVSGSQAAFVAAMNAEARRLGLTGTHFANPSGLADPHQYTDARDLARLAAYVVRRYPTYATYSDVPAFTWNGIRQTNFNPLIGTPGITGLKAGHLGGPDWQLVTTARVQGTTLVAVVLNAPTEAASASDTLTLLSWAKDNFTQVPVHTAALRRTVPVYEGSAGSVPVRPVRAVPNVLWVPRTTTSGLRAHLALPAYLVAPVAAGRVVGSWTLRTALGSSVYRVSMVTAARVPRGNFLSVLFGRIALFFARLHL